MAISVNWVTGVVSVPKADTTLTGTDPISGREIRSFDTDQFHVNLRIAEDSLEGRSWPLTHQYNAESTLGGTIYAPQLIMVNSYQVEFEATVTPWRVVFTSTNNNIADFSVVNHVSIQPGNSAGLQIVATGSALQPGEKAELSNINSTVNSNLKVVEGTDSHAMVMRVIRAALCGTAKDADTDGPITEDTVRIAYMSSDGSKPRLIFDVVNLFGTRTGATLDMSP